jgi:hypothetical protein
MATSTNGYAILLMNTGRDSREPSPAAKRQEAFTKIVEDLKPSIIFTQECTGPFAKYLGDQYLKLGIPEAGFIFNVNEFLHTDYTLDTDLANLVNRLRKEQRISGDFQFLGRVRVVRFTSKGVPDLEVLALSWHGQNRISDNNKLKFLKELFLVVKEIRKIETFRGKAGKMLPIIVGGDFNIHVTKWPSDPDLVCHRYTPAERRKERVIDLFVTTKDIIVKHCKFVDLSFKLNDGTLVSDLLKHDPVQGVLAYSNDSDVTAVGGQTNMKNVNSPNQKPTSSNDKPKLQKDNPDDKSQDSSSDLLKHDSVQGVLAYSNDSDVTAVGGQTNMKKVNSPNRKPTSSNDKPKLQKDNHDDKSQDSSSDLLKHDPVQGVLAYSNDSDVTAVGGQTNMKKVNSPNQNPTSSNYKPKLHEVKDKPDDKSQDSNKEKYSGGKIKEANVTVKVRGK